MELYTSFSIEATINPETKEPFGSKYAGTFSIRRPTLQDRTNIALRVAANLAAAGGVGVSLLTDELLDVNYIFAQLSVIKTADLPEWFDKNKLFVEDEIVIKVISDEVQKFLDSFRSKNDAPVVVPTAQ